jgi:hypothetical protein
MQATSRVHNIFTRLDVQVVGITKEDFCAKLQQVVVRNAFHGSCGTNRHKEGCLHFAMGRLQNTSSANRGLLCKGEH